jgi:hypothetical protein
MRDPKQRQSTDVLRDKGRGNSCAQVDGKNFWPDLCGRVMRLPFPALRDIKAE